MLWRKRLFTILAILTLVWMAIGFAANNDYDAAKSAPDSAGGQAGRAVGNTLTVAVFLCTGLPVLLFSLFMRWRNGVGLQRQRELEIQERRHQEALEAMRGAR